MIFAIPFLFFFSAAGKNAERSSPRGADPRRGGGPSSVHDLGPDTLVREDFQQKGMRNAAVDHVHLACPGFESVHGAADLRKHSAGKNAFPDQIVHLGVLIEEIRVDSSFGSRRMPGTSLRKISLRA